MFKNKKNITVFFSILAVAIFAVLIIFFVYRNKYNDNNVKPINSSQIVSSEKESETSNKTTNNNNNVETEYVISDQNSKTSNENKSEKKVENKNNENSRKDSKHKSYQIPSVTMKSLHYEDCDQKDKIIKIKLDYPVIENKNGLKSIEILNSYFKNEAEKNFQDIKSDFYEMKSAFEENNPNIDYKLVHEENSKITKHNKNGILSVSRWEIREHQGPTWVISNSFVIDYLNGKKLNIFDVIKGKKEKILDMIKKETIKEMKKIHTISDDDKNDIEYCFSEESGKDWKAQTFYLDDKSLVVEFSKGEITSLVWGEISVNIPYETIKKYGLSIDSKFTD